MGRMRVERPHKGKVKCVKCEACTFYFHFFFFFGGLEEAIGGGRTSWHGASTPRRIRESVTRAASAAQPLVPGLLPNGEE